MKKANLRDASSWFDVLITSDRTQAAVMRLDPGFLVLEGAVDAEVGGEKARLRQGDLVIVPAGTPHRFRSAGNEVALTFNVYGPPAY